MRILVTSLIALGLFASETDGFQGVESIPEARLVEIRREPEAPTSGEVFDLHLRLRVAPGLVAFVPDTLLPTAAAESAGSGVWTAEPAPGDSTDILAVYPVIGYREALVEYPWIELWFRLAGPADEGVPVRAAGETALRTDEAEQRLLRLGGVELGLFAPMAEGGLSLFPQPAADVLGSRWSLWFLLGSGLIVLVAVAGAGVAGRRWWRIRAAFLDRRGIRTPRQVALGELDRVLALEWHRNGRVDEFYASSSDTLRRFAREIDPGWGPDLTSTELLRKLSERWGPEQVASLAAAVEAAERVKFGERRPGPEAAEGDWQAIRDWIREAPEG